MKKILLSIVLVFAAAVQLSAQKYNVVITDKNGAISLVPADSVASISFGPADQNVEQIIIKELYNGGCQPNSGTSYFQRDKGFIIYNNGGDTAVVNNLAIGELSPYNAEGTNNWSVNGSLTYANESYVPLTNGIWYFPQALVLAPYEQVVVSCFSSIDNTVTYTNSVNYANPAYYAMYDPESGYSSTSWYPTPAEEIPTSHYLKAVQIGQGSAWTLSAMSPAFVIFQTKGITPAAWANNADNYVYEPGKAQTVVFRNLALPREWVIDGIEVYNSAKLEDATKRLTDDIDAGYVKLTNKLGHTLYRNVDVEETEAIEGNKEKLVYGYSLGVDGSTDPSGIDAEASIKNGAKIVYFDSNNSSNDFHERQQFSIK